MWAKVPIQDSDRIVALLMLILLMVESSAVNAIKGRVKRLHSSALGNDRFLQRPSVRLTKVLLTCIHFRFCYETLSVSLGTTVIGIK